MKKIDIVKIVYYTGTGGTRLVAECFEKRFKEAGKHVFINRLTSSFKDEIVDYDLLVVIYAVHAFNAPMQVYKWIEETSPVQGIPAAVISVSGGGEISPNTASRRHCIKKLEKKGFNVTYEDMIVMPSNTLIPTIEPLALLLLQALPVKTGLVVDDIIAGFGKRTRPVAIDVFYSFIGEIEKLGARRVGEKIRVSDDCNGCGWCERNCPSGNITMAGGKPVFDGICQLCLGCMYGCPKKALSPGYGKFIIIKEGFSLPELLKKLPVAADADIETIAKGFAWSGVRKYLLDLGEGGDERTDNQHKGESGIS